ncbi:hypothetical protein HK405_007827 [Cladochytrium tenue]|nr:hypothetical protein HK405_007827 [Cladochytrium tenue]
MHHTTHLPPFALSPPYMSAALPTATKLSSSPRTTTATPAPGCRLPMHQGVLSPVSPFSLPLPLPGDSPMATVSTGCCNGSGTWTAELAAAAAAAAAAAEAEAELAAMLGGFATGSQAAATVTDEAELMDAWWSSAAPTSMVLGAASRTSAMASTSPIGAPLLTSSPAATVCMDDLLLDFDEESPASTPFSPATELGGGLTSAGAAWVPARFPGYCGGLQEQVPAAAAGGFAARLSSLDSFLAAVVSAEPSVAGTSQPGSPVSASGAWASPEPAAGLRLDFAAAVSPLAMASTEDDCVAADEADVKVVTSGTAGRRRVARRKGTDGGVGGAGSSGNGSKARSFVCPHAGCGSSFFRSQDLERHLATHLPRDAGRFESRPYECPNAGCGRRYGRADAANRHGRLFCRAWKRQQQAALLAGGPEAVAAAVAAAEAAAREAATGGAPAAAAAVATVVAGGAPAVPRRRGRPPSARTLAAAAAAVAAAAAKAQAHAEAMALVQPVVRGARSRSSAAPV